MEKAPPLVMKLGTTCLCVRDFSMLQAQRLEPLSFNIQTDPEFYKTVESTILTLFQMLSLAGEGILLFIPR